MTSGEAERPVRLSVLDRLIDPDPRAAADPPRTREQSVTELKAALLRDVTWLLNTRRVIEPAPDRYPELQTSVYHYGLPDITSLSGDSLEVRRRLARQVEETIRLFEPRLMGVKVTAADPKGENERRIRFVIEGILRTDPDPERVVFDTVFEPVSGAFEVGGDANA